MTHYKTFELKDGNILNIYYDEDFAENPQVTWDNLGHCEFFHKRYKFGNENLFTDHIEAQNYALSNKVISLPVYMYEHSGITISTTSFNCQWDSGLLGYIWVSKENVRNEFGVKSINKKLKEKVLDILQAQINLLDDYVQGNVFGFKVIDKNTNQEIDSCWGFYGIDFSKSGLFEQVGITEDDIVNELNEEYEYL